MALEFRYRAEQGPGGQIIQRPVVQAKLCGPSGLEIAQFFYLDSGADYTVIPYKLGLFLGLVSNGQRVQNVQGINGVVGVIYSMVQMTICNLSFPAQIAWAQIEHAPLLLGRADVFDLFDITFKQAEGLIIFQEARKDR